LNPDIQSRVRDEINQAVEENDGKITYDLINRLEYLEMVTNESLRKYPPAFFLSRVCTKDFQIPETDLVIPKGTHININVYSLHCDPEYYPEPQKFDPERFSPENIKMRPQCSYIPFGEYLKLQLQLFEIYLFIFLFQVMDQDAVLEVRISLLFLGIFND